MQHHSTPITDVSRVDRQTDAPELQLRGRQLRLPKLCVASRVNAAYKLGNAAQSVIYAQQVALRAPSAGRATFHIRSNGKPRLNKGKASP